MKYEISLEDMDYNYYIHYVPENNDNNDENNNSLYIILINMK